MIKRLIFDVDNTLIKWQDKYVDAIKETVLEYGINIDYKKFDDLVLTYEKNYDYYSKELMLEHFNKNLNLKLGIDFINSWLTKLSAMSDIDDDTLYIIKLLSSDYDLVILSNWFKDNQKKRLEHVKLDKYFNDFYGGEKGIKPNISAFNYAKGKYLPSECIMIGDDYVNDGIGAVNAGMNAIILNSKVKDNNNIIYIDSIKDVPDAVLKINNKTTL